MDENCASVANNKRKMLGMTVRALAQKTGIEENALGRLLVGKRKMSASELLAISDVLGLTFLDFTSMKEAQP